MDEISEFLANNPDVETFDTIVSDLCGVIRGKRLDRDGIVKVYKNGLQMPGSTVFLDVTGDCSDPEGMGESDGDPDVNVRPIPGTLVRVPWFNKPMAQLLVSFYEDDGRPYYYDPRHVLQRVLDRFSELGLRPMVALEQEFYLIDPEGALEGNPQPPISPLTGRRLTGTQVYSINELEAFGSFLDQVNEACKIQNIPVGPVIAEFSTAQFEINLNHTDDVLSACDHALLLPRVVKGVAQSQGFEATFMAKPFPDQAGSGMHMHVSLMDEKGNNIFSGGDETGNDKLHNAVAGLLETMTDAVGIFAPNINSYRRFVPNTFAPMARRWAANNRSVAVRIPSGDDANRRLEHRIAGADANPYLSLAAVLAGIHHGITNNLTPPAISTGDASLEPDPEFPTRWNWALNRLLKSELMADYLGEDYCKLYVAAKRDEMDSFMSKASRREYEWYLRSEG